MSTFLEVFIGGLLLGGIYALAAFGLATVFGVLGVLNIAHGDLLMLGALASYLLFTYLGLNPFVHILVLIPVFLLLGFLCERVLLRPIEGKPHTELLVSSILITLGLSLFISDLTNFSIGQPYLSVPYSLPSVRVGGMVLSWIRILVLGVIVVLTVALHQYIRRTYMGKSIRAITQDKEGARIVGIDVGRVSMFAFGIGTALAAVAGVFFIILFPVEPYIGIPLTVRYLCIIVLGGLGSLPGTLVSGLLLGVVEAFAGYLLGLDWQLTVPFIILILVLIFRPRGLFGAA
ncbi:MAG: branched-chain amino acid ABC transporter permease [Nitrospinota bacterium]